VGGVARALNRVTMDVVVTPCEYVCLCLGVELMHGWVAGLSTDDGRPVWLIGVCRIKQWAVSFCMQVCWAR
jgi:hypothetical protein